MKIDCDVARDLMPLVIDEVASKSSVNLINKHISECKECNAYWFGMSRELPETKKSAETGRMLHQLRKVQKMRVLMITFIGLIIGCLLVWGGLSIKEKLQKEPTVPADLQCYDYRLVKLDNEHVAVLEVINNELPYAISRWCVDYVTEGETSICYLSMQLPLLKGGLSFTPEVHYWQTWSVRDGQIIVPFHENPVTEIRKGTPTNYQILWTMEDTIPDASPEFLQYIMLCNEWYSLETIVVDGANQFADKNAAWQLQTEMSLLSNTVPELQLYPYSTK